MCLAYVRAVRRSYVRAVRRWLTWSDDGALQSLSIRKVRLSSWGPAIMGPAIMGPAIMAPAILGPAIMGPGGPGSMGVQQNVFSSCRSCCVAKILGHSVNGCEQLQ